MKDEENQKLIVEYEHFLRDGTNRSPIELTLKWARDTGIGPGVYAIYDGKTLLYVGESGDLSGRLSDLRYSKHHSFRRKFGEYLYGNYDGFVPATTERNFPDRFERLVDKSLKKLRLVALTIPFGRKEFEEHMIDRTTKQRPAFNSKGQRRT